MQPIGMLVEFKNGQVKNANAGLATALCGQHRQLVALVVDGPVDQAKSNLEVYGVDLVVDIKTCCGGWQPEIQSAAVVAAMAKYEIDTLVGLTSPAGRELLPRIAARLEAPLVMDCIDIDLDGHKAITSQYSGKTLATIALSGRQLIYGLRPNTVAPTPAPKTAQIVEFGFDAAPGQDYQVVETRTNGSSGPDLAESDVILSGGRGMKNGDNFNVLFDCARQMKAGVGASRVAVDEGWVPYAMQVGQTGVKVNPKVYIACGISGSIQHFAGMKSAGMIIAINIDPDAAIMSNCDYFAVADLFEVIPEVTRLIKDSRQPA